jgi:hypothetical protein
VPTSKDVQELMARVDALGAQVAGRASGCQDRAGQDRHGEEARAGQDRCQARIAQVGGLSRGR